MLNLLLYVVVLAGVELRDAPPSAVPLGGGYYAVDRSRPREAEALPCPDLAPRLVADEDREVDVALVWADCPSAAAPARALQVGQALYSAGHETRVEKLVETGSFGLIGRLHTEKRHPRVSGLLRDAAGQPAAWYCTRVLDGQLFSFAVPLERLLALRRKGLWSVAEWEARRRGTLDEVYQRGLGYLWIEDYEGAEYYLQQASRLEPGSAETWYQLGFAQGKRGRLPARIQSYRRALELDPDHAAARYSLGVTLLLLGRAEESREHLAHLYRLLAPEAEKLAGMLGLIHVDLAPLELKRAPR